jgi:hypothetical protein
LTFQIISERDTTLLVLENGKVKQYSKDLYNITKLKRYNGGRIIDELMDKETDDSINVQETFTKGIFNITYRDTILQLRDRNKVCAGVEDWYHTNKIKQLVDTFTEQYKIQEETKVFKVMANMFPDDRVKITNEGFVVDGVWLVDKQGTSYLSSKSPTRYAHFRTNIDPHSKKKLLQTVKWNFLCLVPKGKVHATYIETEIGSIKLEETDMVILSKVAFLLDPRKVFDRVFMNQLPDKLQKVLKDEYDETKNTS